jgi:hypothetical protein
MAVSISNIFSQTGGSFNGGGTTTSTNSVSWVTGQLYIAVINLYNTAGNGATYPTALANVAGITWTNRFSSTAGGGSNGGIQVWTGVSTSTTSAALVMTTSFQAGNFDIKIDTATGINTSGTVVQTANTSSASSPVAVTLAAFGSSSNATYGVFRSTLSQANTTLAAKAGYTATNGPGNTTNNISYMTEYLASSDTSPNASFSTGASPTVYAFAMEIKAAATATPNVCVSICG